MKQMTRISAAGLAIALGACGSKPAPEGPVGFERAPAPLTAVGAVQFLPAETPGLLVGPSLAGSARRLGRDRFVEGAPQIYREAAEEITRVFGTDLLDPANAARAGIDADGGWGFAWLTPDDEPVVLFARLSDPEAFLAMIERVAVSQKTSIEKVYEGPASVLWLRGEASVAFVVRDGWGLLLAGDRGGGVLDDARALARRKPADSLASAPGFRDLADRLAFGGDAALYVDIAALVEHERQKQAERGERYSSRIAEIDASLAELADDDPGTAAEADGLRRERGWLVQDQARLASEGWLSAALGGMKLAAGMTVDGPSIRTKLVLDAPAGSLLRRLLLPGKGTPALARALHDTPALMLSARVDPKEVVATVSQIAAADLDDVEAGKALLRQMTGIDFDREVLPLLDGEIGIAATGNLGDAQPSPEGYARQFHGHLALGLTDPAAAEALLGRLVDKLRLRREEAGGVDAVTVDVPFWKPVHIAVVGEHLLATSDVAVLARLARGEQETFVARAQHPGVRTSLQPDGAAAIFAMSPTLSGLWMMAGGPYIDESTAKADPASPPSEAVREAERAVAEAQRRVAVLRQESRERGMRLYGELAERMGIMAMTFELGDHGLVGHGGQFLGDRSVGDFVAWGVRAMREQQAHSRAQMEAYEELWRLKAQLDAARAQEEMQRREERAAPPRP